MQLCTTYALYGTKPACNQAVPYFYQRSGAFYSISESETKYWTQQGMDIYNSIPYNKALGAVAYIGYSIDKNDYKIPVSSHINLEYNGKYSCNLHWEF